MLINSENIDEIVSSIAHHVEQQTALISIAENTNVDIHDLIQALNKKNVRFMGGIFPKVIHNNSLFDSGIVINTLIDVVHLDVVKDISQRAYKIPKIQFHENENYSLFTYVDGLTSNISKYLSQLYEAYGMQTNYFGGGAGSLSLIQKPCVFSNEGFFEDAAIFCIMKMTSRIGVKHGWSKVDGPFIVTKASGNIIKEINWESPFAIYKRVVENHSNLKFDEDNFFDIAKGYPFGILKNDAECIVRDPLKVTKNGELVCVGELEDNTLVDILNGNEKSLISAAKSAVEDSLKFADHPKKAFIIDCISRILFLEDQFTNELNAITDTIKAKFPDISIAGALTLGEISSYGEGYLEFYNKTVVVGLFE